MKKSAFLKSLACFLSGEVISIPLFVVVLPGLTNQTRVLGIIVATGVSAFTALCVYQREKGN